MAKRPGGEFATRGRCTPHGSLVEPGGRGPGQRPCPPHRQERPVTIYRLVAKETIEERILKLHATKRDLADGLLEGTGDGGRLSYDDMLALVRGAAETA